MKRFALFLALLLLLNQLALVATTTAQSRGDGFSKTSLLADKEINALAAEINGLIAKDTVAELARNHRVQASSGYAHAAQFIAAKAKEYGLEQVQVEHFSADGKQTYYTLKSTPGWEATSASLWETEPRRAKVADYDEMRVALADYSKRADLTATLVDVGSGTAAKDYDGKGGKGRIVLAGGNVAAAD